jgi:hypothetical protein
MSDRLVHESTSYPLLQRQQVIDPDDEVKDYSELFKETVDDMHDMTCNDSYKIYNTEGTPYLSHSASYSDLTHLPGPLLTVVQNSSPHEEVKVYRTEDTPYNFSNASSFSDLTGMSGQHSITDVTHSALTSPRPEPLPKLFSPPIAAASSPKLSTVHEDIVETPLMCSRGSPLGSISDEECNQIGDENGSICSEFSRREESEAVSPSDLPESPGEVEPPAKRYTKPTPPPLPPKPKGLQIKLQARRSESFVPPPTKFQDVPPELPVPSHSETINLPINNRANGQKDDESEDEDEDDLGDDNEFFKKCLEMGMHARSSVAVPKIIRSETKSQSISISSASNQNQKTATSEIVDRNGRCNMSAIESDSESGDEDGSDYAFIKMYMEKGLKIEPEKEKENVAEVIRPNSPPPPPLPAKRKTTIKTAACVTEKAKSEIGTKPVPRPAVRSGSWIASGNVPHSHQQHRQQHSSPSPAFQFGDHSDPRTANSRASSSCSSLRKPYLETDIDSILNYEKYLSSFSSGGAAGGSIESHC